MCNSTTAAYGHCIVHAITHTAHTTGSLPFTGGNAALEIAIGLGVLLAGVAAQAAVKFNRRDWHDQP